VNPFLTPIHLALVALSLAGACGAAADGIGLSLLLETRVAANRGLNLLLTHQRADGSWAGDAITTAQVLICVANAPGRDDEARRAAAVVPAVAYLRGVVAAACDPGTGGGAEPVPTAALAAALTALARDSVSAHRDLLAQGRARLLAAVRPLELPGGAPGLAFGSSADGAPEVWTTCAALDGLLVTEGLEPAWNREGYKAVTAYLQDALRGLPSGSSDVAPLAAGDAPTAAVQAVGLVRALLSLGMNSNEPPLAEALRAALAAPPKDPAAIAALAEALSLARPGMDKSALAPLAGWRVRLVELLLGTQQGDGGWAAPVATVPRDRSTAFALRAIQTAAGRDLAEPVSPAP
jgi:hypothetical protein